jgi:hypothetical protein
LQVGFGDDMFEEIRDLGDVGRCTLSARPRIAQHPL